MSKMKSKFRPKAKSTKQSTEAQIWCIKVTEYEKDLGVRTDDLLEFSPEEKAVAYAAEYNKKSAELDTPDHFFQAIAFPKDQATKE